MDINYARRRREEVQGEKRRLEALLENPHPPAAEVVMPPAPPAERFESVEEEEGDLEGETVEEGAETGATATAGAAAAAADEGEEMDANKLRARLAEVARLRRAVQRKRERVMQQTQMLRDAARGWERTRNSLSYEQQKVHEAADSIRAGLRRVTRDLRIAMQLSTLNDCFFVWYSGPFATINGFRLGRLPTHVVDWAETNAALGQAALAVQIVAEKARYEFRRTAVYPQGSFPKVGRVDDQRNVYNLYTDGSFSFFRSSFSSALTAFLNCIQELGEYATSQDVTIQLPYPITDGKINGLSLQISNADTDKWTRALKYMLTDLKWILVWSAKSNVD